MKRHVLLLALVSGVAAFAACASEDEKRGPSLTTRPEGTALPVDHPPMEAVNLPSSSRRLDVAQLQAAWAVALGKDKNGNDITWKLPDNTQGLARYQRTLGEPDYVASTDLNHEPSLLYAKFMDDAGRSVCDQALDADMARTKKDDRVLLRHVEWAETTATPALDENLKYLKLRFHGVRVKDAAEIAPLRTLFTSAAKGTSPAREGWRTVCVALVTAPEFHLY
jgi:hypothetical protein